MGIRLSGDKIRLRGSSIALTTPAIPVAGEGLTITDLAADSQIFQRIGTSKEITVSGTYTGLPSRILARAVPVGTAVSDVGFAWQTLANYPSGGSYSGLLTVSQGGWYILQVKDSVNSTINASGANKFAVGIVVALIGQSNMVGLATAVDQYPLADQLTRVFKDGAWVFGGNHDDTLTHPAGSLFSTYGGTYTNGAEKGDGEVFFANYLRESTGVPVGVINKAVGGSAISTWQPSGGANYAAFISALNAAGGDCEAAIWYQGEDNASVGTSAASYKASLVNVLSGLKTQTARSSGFNFGVVTLGTTASYGAEGSFGLIRGAQIDFVNENAANGAFYAATACDAGTSDGVHLGGVAQARLGKRYAAGLLKALGATTYGMAGATITGASRFGAIVTVNISHDGGTTLLDGAGGSGASLLGFRVYDDGVLKTISSTAISGNTVVLTLSATPSGAVAMDYAMANAPFTTTVLASSIAYDNNTVTGDTLGRPLQPKTLFAVT